MSRLLVAALWVFFAASPVAVYAQQARGDAINARLPDYVEHYVIAYSATSTPSRYVIFDSVLSSRDANVLLKQLDGRAGVHAILLKKESELLSMIKRFALYDNIAASVDHSAEPWVVYQEETSESRVFRCLALNRQANEALDMARRVMGEEGGDGRFTSAAPHFSLLKRVGGIAWFEISERVPEMKPRTVIMISNYHNEQLTIVLTNEKLSQSSRLTVDAESTFKKQIKPGIYRIDVENVRGGREILLFPPRRPIRLPSTELSESTYKVVEGAELNLLINSTHSAPMIEGGFGVVCDQCGAAFTGPFGGVFKLRRHLRTKHPGPEVELTVSVVPPLGVSEQ